MTLDNQQVLVTGANGFLGTAIIRQLTASGAQVQALVRSPHKAVHLRDLPRVTVVQGDITDAARLHDAATGCQVIIHAAAALNGDFATFRAVNIDGTRNVMRAAHQAQVTRVVHISSIAVYGYGHTTDITEARPLAPGKGGYPITKAQAESVVREFGRARAVDYAIIRPGAIFGPGGRGWTLGFFRRATRPLVRIIGDGSGTLPAIYVDDVAAMCALAATHPAASGEAFNCVMDPAPTVRGYLGAWAALAGVEHPAWLSVEPWVAYLIARLRSLGVDTAAHEQDALAAVRQITQRIRFRMDKARAVLGWEPPTSLPAGVAQTAAYLRDQGALE